MLQNLQKGDFLIKKEPISNGMGGAILKDCKVKVLAVCGDLVGLSFEDDFEHFSGNWKTFIGLEQNGWQLEKKRWVPQYDQKVWFVNASGLVLYIIWNTLVEDQDKWQFRLKTGNYHPTEEAAEAYRTKLIEVMGKEGV